MKAILCGIFFLSGASALIFETLWFHQSGLVFGNGVWASSLVLAAFMVGLAVGNGIAARVGHRVLRPVRLYALLELTIAAGGLAIVWGLPGMVPALKPLLRATEDFPALANTIRFAAGFVVMLAPAMAMGATLPLLVKALLARDDSFGSVLGRLYGWNTLGAMTGALAGEAALLESLGVRGTALFAAGLNGVIALSAIAISSAFRPGAGKGSAPARARASWPARRLLAAAFLSGFALLALEVVWFRFLSLRIHGSSLVFAVMLAVVLLGISLGGLVGGAILRRWPGAHRLVPCVSLCAGATTAALYPVLDAFPVPLEYSVGWLETAKLACALMLPVALLSGIAFTGIGAAVGEVVDPPVRAVGWMTLWNTLGSGVGPLVAGFVLLPYLGMEHSFVLLASLYALVAVLAWPAARAADSAHSPNPRAIRIPALVAAVLFSVALATFPFGLMDTYLRVPVERFAGPNAEVVVVREGRTETVVYTRHLVAGQPFQYRLITDGYSMSGTSAGARRYMKLYVYLPVALHPGPRKALLISFGVGSTAKALTDTRELEHIDVVDLSREVLEESRVVFPDPAEHPLNDPRVEVHVEDGRQFLELTEHRYDLITGEPPPPKNAGIVSLYTREYFQLVHDRLAPGGIHTYWVPIHGLRVEDTEAIVRAYCDVFADCSLWSATGADWMLVGSRGAAWEQLPADRIARQWNDPALIGELRTLGLDRPEMLAAAFSAGPDWLRERTRDVEPLVDDWPKRLSDVPPDPPAEWERYWEWIDPQRGRARFESDRTVSRAWPADLRHASLPYFDAQEGFVIRSAAFAPTHTTGQYVASLDQVLRETDLVGLPLLMMKSSLDHARLVAGLSAADRAHGPAAGHRGRQLLAERAFEDAARELRRARVRMPDNQELRLLAAYAAYRAGLFGEADAVARAGAKESRDPSGFEWLVRRIEAERSTAEPGR